MDERARCLSIDFVLRSRRMLWIVWAGFLALLALVLGMPQLVTPRSQPWTAAETAVAGFVLTLLSFAAGIGTFAVRENLVLSDLRTGALDPRTPDGFLQVRRMLLALWTLCLLIGIFGGVIAHGSATPAGALPYVVAAAVLLAIHAPRRWLFAGPEPGSS